MVFCWILLLNPAKKRNDFARLDMADPTIQKPK